MPQHWCVVRVMGGSNFRVKLWRYAARTKKSLRGFLGHSIVHGVFEFLLMLGILYFLMAGALVLAFRTDSFWMAVYSDSMRHYGDGWRNYFENETTRQLLFSNAGLSIKNLGAENTSTFPIQGGFEKGDLLIIQGVSSPSEIAIGDVLIVDLGPNNMPLVHRVIAIWEENGDVRFTTKGDGNPVLLSDDKFTKPEQIRGKVVFVIPKLGYISLWFRGQ